MSGTDENDFVKNAHSAEESAVTLSPLNIPTKTILNGNDVHVHSNGEPIIKSVDQNALKLPADQVKSDVSPTTSTPVKPTGWVQFENDEGKTDKVGDFECRYLRVNIFVFFLFLLLSNKLFKPSRNSYLLYVVFIRLVDMNCKHDTILFFFKCVFA